jgi:hypothetical protein
MSGIGWLLKIFRSFSPKLNKIARAQSEYQTGFFQKKIELALTDFNKHGGKSVKWGRFARLARFFKN